jgi:hypothetical protein
MKHTLTNKEINNIPSGRIMNTFITEYVIGDYATRWSNYQQEEISCHWFEEHPRCNAEDDGNYCTADGLLEYSTDISRALSITRLMSNPLSTHTYTDQGVEVFWATFSTVAFNDTNYRWRDVWATGETLALAICRAALLAV